MHKGIVPGYCYAQLRPPPRRLAELNWQGILAERVSRAEKPENHCCATFTVFDPKTTSQALQWRPPWGFFPANNIFSCLSCHLGKFKLKFINSGFFIKFPFNWAIVPCCGLWAAALPFSLRLKPWAVAPAPREMPPKTPGTRRIWPIGPRRSRCDGCGGKQQSGLEAI